MSGKTRNIYLCPPPPVQAKRKLMQRSKSEGILSKTTALPRYVGSRGIVRSYNTQALPYLTPHSGSPNGNVEALTKFNSKQLAFPTAEDQQQLAAQMKKLRREGNHTYTRGKAKHELERRRRLQKYEPREHMSYSAEEMRVMREQLYGTQREKEVMRERQAAREARRAHIRQLPLEHIWDPQALRSRKAQERSQAELEDFMRDLPPPAPKKSSFGDEMSVAKMGFGKKGVLEGEVTMMMRCVNLPQPKVAGLQTVNMMGHEDECLGQGWRCFGETNKTDEVIDPIFPTRFVFTFTHPTSTVVRLRVLRKATGGKSVFLGGCEVNLHDLIRSYYEAHDASESHFVEHIQHALHANEHPKLRTLVQSGDHLANDPKHHITHQYRHSWMPEEEVAMVHVPMSVLDSESEELGAQLKQLASEIVFVVGINPIKFRAPPPGRQLKSKDGSS